jgi:hypothetical protein
MKGEGAGHPHRNASWSTARSLELVAQGRIVALDFPSIRRAGRNFDFFQIRVVLLIYLPLFLGSHGKRIVGFQNVGVARGHEELDGLFAHQQEAETFR